jgi:aldehyde dehydrogenase (NAD+)
MGDADLDAAVEGVVDAVWFNQGEVCCAGTRILVAESVADRFRTLLKARMASLRVGNPLDKSTDIGAIVNPRQLARIRDLVAQGVAAGAVAHEGTAPEGCFCSPILLDEVSPASPCVSEEIFGPVVTLQTFRTPPEAVDLANATRYGLAASIWSENLTVAMDLAAQVKAGVVWINATNLFDANAPFGGMRASGFGREGAREGMAAYLRKGTPVAGQTPPAIDPRPATGTPDGLDRTQKLYIGGAQKRADGGTSWSVMAGDTRLGHAPFGNRKDIRNAVEAAQKAGGWTKMSGHQRAQVLYFLAETLDHQRSALAAQVDQAEIDASIARTLYYAAWADKLSGAVHNTQSAHVTLAMREAFGVIGLVCGEEAPLLGALSLILPAIAMGNRVVVVPSQTNPLAALELGPLLGASDVPSGVVNIVSGPVVDLAQVLAAHDDVAAMAISQPAIADRVERESAGNLKPVWHAPAVDGQGRDWLEAMVQIKTIWVPYGA